MGLLNSDERLELIDLLSSLLDMNYPPNRLSLVATLPDAIQKNIRLGDSVRSDITSIVDAVSSDSYARWKLNNDDYPILVVIKNAKGIVGGGPHLVQLNQQGNMLRAKFGLPPEETSATEALPPECALEPEFPHASDQFLKELYNFIQELPGLAIQLESIQKTFDRYLIKQKCLKTKVRLTNVYNTVHNFTVVLKQSKDSKITNNSTSLSIALTSFENQSILVESNIGQFCEDYGTKMEKEQPAAERHKRQKDLDNLIKYCNSVLEAAQNLYKLLSSYYIGKR